MAIRTTTVTINAAFLREIKEDNQRLKELLAELREALGERPTNDALTRHQLIEKLSDFRDLLATHFALEEAFGYFDEPLMAAPRLAERAEELRQEHARLFVRLCGLPGWPSGRKNCGRNTPGCSFACAASSIRRRTSSSASRTNGRTA